jgi:hypothetical protein
MIGINEAKMSNCNMFLIFGDIILFHLFWKLKQMLGNFKKTPQIQMGANKSQH